MSIYIDELVLFVIRTESGSNAREVAWLLDYSYDYIVRSFKRLYLTHKIKSIGKKQYVLIESDSYNELDSMSI